MAAQVQRSQSTADLGSRAERAAMLRLIHGLEDDVSECRGLQRRSQAPQPSDGAAPGRSGRSGCSSSAFALSAGDRGAASRGGPSPARLRDLATPSRPAPERRGGFLRAARSRRAQGRGGLDALLSAGAEDGGRGFWLYASQKVTQRLMGTLLGASGATVSRDALLQTPLCCALRRKIDALMATAVSRHRCGVLFDLISTSTIIRSGVPRVCGEYVYEYIESKHADKLALRFVFVGITDNTNCCAARDVFCREYDLNGRYVGDTKRQFDALDNVHMQVVFPRRGRTADPEVPNPALMRPPGGPPLRRRPAHDRRHAAASPIDGEGPGRAAAGRSAAAAAAAAFMTDGPSFAASQSQRSADSPPPPPPRPLSVAEKRAAFDRRDWAFFSPEAGAPAPTKRKPTAGLPDLVT